MLCLLFANKRVHIQKTSNNNNNDNFSQLKDRQCAELGTS